MKPCNTPPRGTRMARLLERASLGLALLGAVASSGAGPAQRGFTIAPLPQLPNGATNAPAPTSGTDRPAALDPTRPPAGLAGNGRPSPTSGVSSYALPPAAVTPSYPPAPAPATPPAERPRLQALQLPTSGEPSAMVDGQILKIGDRLGDLTVADIVADGIVMKGARGKEHWPLVPKEKKPLPRSATPKEQDSAPQSAPAATVAGRKEP